MGAAVTHPFVSSKSDGVDTTLVRPSNWNANHKAAGGAAGQVLGWDSAQTEQMAWIEFGPRINLAYEGGFERWDNGASSAPNGWNLSGAGATVAQASGSGNVKEGSYAATITRVGNDCALTQNLDLLIPTFGLPVFEQAGTGALKWFHSRTVCMGVWVKCSVTNAARISITDGVDTFNSSFHSGEGGYEFLTVDGAFGNTGNELTVKCQVVNTNTSATFDQVVVTIGSKAGLTDKMHPSIYRPRTTTIPFGSVTAQAQNTTRYYNWAGSSTNEVEVSWILPYRARLSNLNVIVNSAPPAGQTIDITVRTGETTNTSLAATITSAERTSINTTGILVSAGTVISVQVVTSATSGSKIVRGTFDIEEYPGSF